MSNTQRRLVKFTVEGAGQFPVDMLRYDACFPDTERDSYAITYEDEKRQVTLCSWVFADSRVPTDGRWQSFLWKVVRP